MRIVIKNLLIAALPLLLGFAAGYAFSHTRASCGSMVGPLFAAKCHGRVLQYQMQFQTLGTALGCVLVALIGVVRELRARRAVQSRASSQGDAP
jgi:hypothetical protein